MALARSLADLIFPPLCQVCRNPGEFPLCAACRGRFRLIAPPVCEKCGRPSGGPALPGDTCTRCGRRRAREFTRARAAGIYDDALREAIHALKFGGVRALVRPLSQMMVQTWNSQPAPVDLVVPVPLHRLRFRERGFNQSELLAREVARALRLPMRPHALRRCRATAAQSGLGAAARQANVAAAFEAAERSPKTVLLIDDVFSTGFTVSECARALRRAGAAAVYVLTAAMALPSE